MTVPQVVLDTNVIVAGLRSKRGSAFRLLTLVGTGVFDIHLSVPLVLEYREVLSRQLPNLYLTALDVEEFIEFHCSVATRHQIFFLWRPYLPDPKDDIVLELALKGNRERATGNREIPIIKIRGFVQGRIFSCA
ncbi:MAG: putative toxin-antitoxin system toxin component, PIN family, partial [Nostoc sp.]